MRRGLPILLFLIQSAAAWSLRSVWITFDGYAFLKRAAEAPWGDPFHPLTAPTFAAASAIASPFGISAVDAATLAVCLASGGVVALAWRWFTSLGIRDATAIAPAFAVVWSGITAWASLSIETYAFQLLASVAALVAASRTAARPTRTNIVLLGVAGVAATGFHIASAALWPGLAWWAFREAPASARRFGVLVGTIGIAALAIVLLSPTAEFVPLGGGGDGTTPLRWIAATFATPSTAEADGVLGRSGLLYALGLLTLPTLSGLFGMLRPDTRRLVAVFAIPGWLAWIVTGKSWIALAVPITPVLLFPAARALDASRRPLLAGATACLFGFALAAEVGPNGAGFRERHFSPDPLRSTATTIDALLPEGDAVIAGNSAAPLALLAPGRTYAIAEWVVRGRAAGHPSLAAFREAVDAIHAEGRHVWITKDAVDYLIADGCAESEVLAAIDPTTIRRAGPDDARIARLKKNLAEPPR